LTNVSKSKGSPLLYFDGGSETIKLTFMEEERAVFLCSSKYSEN